MSILVLISSILSAIFLVLALLHLSWAFGSRFGYEESLPTDEQGKLIINPKKVDCVMVGIGLLLFGFIYFLQLGWVQITLSSSMVQYGGWVIPTIFLLRAIGEFKYVGFFKRITQTRFAKLDTKYYSPLCLLIAILGFLLKYL